MKSVKARFALKFGSNVLVAVTSFLTVPILSRTLGPKDLGSFDFITANLNDWLTMLSLNAVMAFFNWSSRRSRDEVIVAALMMVALTVILGGFIGAVMGLAAFAGVDQMLWPEISSFGLVFGLVYALLNFLFTIGISYADARALPVEIESARIIQALLRLGFVVVLLKLNILNLQTLFLLSASAILGSLIFLALVLGRSGNLSAAPIFDRTFGFRGHAVAFLKFMVSYLKPLVVSSLLSIAYAYFDRWLLQWYGGSREQGFYSLAFRLCTIAFLFNTAFAPVLWREFALSHEQKDHNRLNQLLLHGRFLVFVAAIFAIFSSFHAQTVVLIFGGSQYAEAVPAMAIMALYPIHHALAFSNNFLLGTSQTKTYGYLTTAFMLCSIVGSYFLLARTDQAIPGLGLGATGLAIKMVLLQAVFNNLMLYYALKSIRKSIAPWLIFQLKVFAGLYVLNFMSQKLAQFLSGTIQLPIATIGPTRWIVFYSEISEFFVSGCIYLLALTAVAIWLPKLWGIELTVDGLKATVRRRAGLRQG